MRFSVELNYLVDSPPPFPVAILFFPFSLMDPNVVTFLGTRIIFLSPPFGVREHVAALLPFFPSKHPDYMFLWNRTTLSSPEPDRTLFFLSSLFGKKGVLFLSGKMTRGIVMCRELSFFPKSGRFD